MAEGGDGAPGEARGRKGTGGVAGSGWGQMAGEPVHESAGWETGGESNEFWEGAGGEDPDEGKGVGAAAVLGRGGDSVKPEG